MSKSQFGKAPSVYLPSAIAEQKRHGPRRVFDAGKLVFGFGTTGLDCVIMEVSADAARVRVHFEPTIVPKRVCLVHLRAETAYEAEVESIDDNWIDLKFLVTHDLRTATARDLVAMRQLCEEFKSKPGTGLRT